MKRTPSASRFRQITSQSHLDLVRETLEQPAKHRLALVEMMLATAIRAASSVAAGFRFRHSSMAA
jgi:hypothetical protein